MLGALPTRTSVEIRVPTGTCSIPAADPRAAGVMTAEQAEALADLALWRRRVETGDDRGKDDVITRTELVAELEALTIPPDLSEQIAALSKTVAATTEAIANRVEALEKKPAPAIPDMDGLRLRVQALEQRRGGAAPAGAPVQAIDLSPVLRRIEALERAPKTSETTYVGQSVDLEPMKRTVEQIHEIASAAGHGVVEMTGHLSRMQQENADLKARVKWLEETMKGIAERIDSNG